ncbi:MAG: PA2928 family protein [Caldimonas sp.]
MTKILASLAGLLLVAGIAALLLIPRISLDPPRRAGPPALVAQNDADPQLWIITEQEEHEGVGGGRHGMRTDTRYHIDLRSFDSRTARPLWTRRLLTRSDDDGGRSARGRILGQEGATVWLFVADQPVAVAAADGAVRAGRGVLEEKNAALRGVLPDKPEFFAFDDGLVVTAADARRYRIKAGDWQAREYQPRSDDHFRAISFQATQWNGGYRTADFLTRHGMAGGRWLGIYTDAEAADAGADGFGDRYGNSANVRTESGPVRRALRSARIGRTKVFSEGSHPRLFDVVAVPGTGDYLGGGFLVAAGTKVPLVLDEPPGVLVVHRTRADEQGRIAMARLGADLRPAWNVTLPYAQLLNRWQLGDRLVLFGSFPGPENEQWSHEAIAVLDLRDGVVRAWNLNLGQEVPAAAK